MQVVVIPIMMAAMEADVVKGMHDRATEIVKELTGKGARPLSHSTIRALGTHRWRNTGFVGSICLESS